MGSPLVSLPLYGYGAGSVRVHPAHVAAIEPGRGKAAVLLADGRRYVTDLTASEVEALLWPEPYPDPPGSERPRPTDGRMPEVTP